MAGELSQTQERYLEAVLRLQEEAGSARVRDIAEAAGVHKSTVTAALHTLADRGLVRYKPYEAARLTPHGRRRAERLADRRRVLSRFLTRVLGVEPETAKQNAGRVEHAMDEGVLARVVCLLAFLEHRPELSAEWLPQFRRFMELKAKGRSCEEWIREYLNQLEQSERS